MQDFPQHSLKASNSQNFTSFAEKKAAFVQCTAVETDREDEISP